MTDRMFHLLQAINFCGLDNSRWVLSKGGAWSDYMINPSTDDELDLMEPHLAMMDVITPTSSSIVSAEPGLAPVIHEYPPDERRYVGNGMYVNVWYLATILTWREYHVSNQVASNGHSEGGAK